MSSVYPCASLKATEMGRFLGITVKRLAQCRCLDGHVKEPNEMSMAWKPDRRSNFFSSPANLCAVTFITEVSLHVTLSIQSHSLIFHPHLQFRRNRANINVIIGIQSILSRKHWPIFEDDRVESVENVGVNFH